MGALRHFLIYAGTPTTDFNVWISGGGTYDAPKRDVTMISVPGRNGKLTRDNGCFENIEVSYPAFISSNFQKNMDAFRAYMKSFTGYQRLEDTYHPDYYREAILIDSFNPKTTTLNRAADFTIKFNCKPQRFLKVGEKVLTFQGDGPNETIHNPTRYEAKPLIRVYIQDDGGGEFILGDQRVKILDDHSYIDIDCELQDAYTGLNNKNGYIELVTGSFPTLPQGDSGLIIVHGIRKLEIKPRYWTI